MIMTPQSTAGQSRVDIVWKFLRDLLANGRADAVLSLSKNPWGTLPMPTLISDPDKIAQAVPLAPVAPVSTARQAVSLTRSETGKTIAMVMRPCEIRALVELAKLNQAGLDHTLVISMDCMGRMENKNYMEKKSGRPDLDDCFFEDSALQETICSTCSTCDAFIPDNADITICTMGLAADQTGFEANTDKGKAVLEALSFKDAGIASERAQAIDGLKTKRTKAKTRLFEKTAEDVSSIQGFEKFIAGCLNCYNCRSACPVCYCKECVFLTDVFSHPPELIIERARKRGEVKMPVDTSMFHMTRLSHIGHACVGCGQCSSVCPSDIPVADLFRTIGAKTQDFYGYQPGRCLDDPIPQLAAARMPNEKP